MSLSTPSRRAKSADVAALAGVSRTTVSYILNGQGERFPAETHERVLAAAEQLNYRPSPAARSLVRGRSDTIVVLAPDSTWGTNLQDAVDQVVIDTRPLGTNVVVRFSSGNVDSTVESILGMNPLAVVDLGLLQPADRTKLAGSGIITVPQVSERLDPADGLDELIARIQIDELIRREPRDIWFGALEDGRQDAYGPRRFDAIMRECAERDLPVPRMIRVPLNTDGATKAMSRLDRGSRIGIACFNDDVAVAVLAGARELHIKVPEELGVMGMDHTAMGQLWSPRLTTIEFDIRGFMDLAMDELRSALSHSTATTGTTDRALINMIAGQTT